MPEVIVDLPTEYQDISGSLDVKHEEDALCWLWAFPLLFPWRRPIVWLYTPVVGNTRWPGDLWGIDSHGNLIILECKQCRRFDDPFKDFLAFHVEGREELSGKHWVRKIQHHLKAELAFPDSISERPKNKTGGILPRSNRRSHIRRWPILADKIDRQIRSSEYQNAVLEYLNVRSEVHDPTPYYIGLMVVSDLNRPILSNAAIASSKKLQTFVGVENVGAVSIRACSLPSKQAHIISEWVCLT